MKLRTPVRLRRERVTLLRWEPFAMRRVEVPAIRCTVCGGKWPTDGTPAHRAACLDAEINGGRA